jgi:hypothetical protein
MPMAVPSQLPHAINNTNGPTAIATTPTGRQLRIQVTEPLTLGAVTGGASPYTYSVDGSAFTTTINYTGLVSGTHSIDVKDANGCTFSTTLLLIITNGPTAIATTVTNTSCGSK